MTDPALQMLAYELAAIFGVLAIYLGYKQYKKSKAVNAQANTSVKKIKQTKNRRLENLISVLSQKYGLVDEALTQKAESIQKQEQLIHKSQITLFVEQENKTLKVAPQQIEKLVDMCLELLPVGQDRIKAAASDAKTEANDARETLAQTTQKMDLLLDGVNQIKSALSLDQTLEQDREREPEPEPETLTTDNEEVEEQSDSSVEVGDVPEETTDEAQQQLVDDLGEIDIVAGSEVEEPEPEDINTTGEEKPEEMISADDIDSLLDELETEQLVNDGIDLAKSDEEAVEEIVSVFAGYQDEEGDDVETKENAELQDAAIQASSDTSTKPTEQEDVSSDKAGEQPVDEEQQLADMMADIAQDLESASDFLDKNENVIAQKNVQNSEAELDEKADDKVESVAMTAEEIEALTEKELNGASSDGVIDKQKVAELREQVRQKTQKIQQENG